MKKKILKAIKITITIILIVTLVLSLIVSQNEHHIETCNKEHCTWCSIIHIAQEIINTSVIFIIIAIVIGALIYLFLSRLHKELPIFTQSSLIFKKVQFNC